MAWIKGPRCGVDNCASRFYQVLSGQRVCQNGHVQIGLETTGDDDDFVAVGQRIRRPRAGTAAAPAKESDVLRGRQAKFEAAALLQVVYKRQVRFVAARKHLPRRFEAVARDLWTLFLHRSNLESMTLQRLVALVYLTARAVDFPVLLADFNLWIRTAGFPYFECWRLLDPARYARLPAELRRHFRPSAEPGVLALHRTTKSLKRELADVAQLQFAEIDDRYVVFRLCRDLMLAPQVYVGACRLLAHVGKRRFSRDETLFGSEEIPAACAVIMATKLYYGLDGVARTLPTNRRGNEFSWALWRDLMRKLWLLQPDFGRADERLVQFWTGAEVDAYLQWFQVRLSAGTGLDRRLESMFPLPRVADLDEDYTTDVGVINELCALLHANTDGVASPSMETSSTETGIEKSSTETGSLAMGSPGSHYHAYSVRSDAANELPEMVGLLYKLLARFLGADEYHVRRFVRLFEKLAKNQHRTLISGRATKLPAPANSTA